MLLDMLRCWHWHRKAMAFETGSAAEAQGVRLPLKAPPVGSPQVTSSPWC